MSGQKEIQNGRQKVWLNMHCQYLCIFGGSYADSNGLGILMLIITCILGVWALVDKISGRALEELQRLYSLRFLSEVL